MKDLYGYSIEEIAELAKTIVAKHKNWWESGYQHDLVEAAQFGITEFLLNSTTQPSRMRLWKIGMEYAQREIREQARVHRPARQPGNGHRKTLLVRLDYDPMNVVVEKVAVHQILQKASRTAQNTLCAYILAEGDRSEAARLSGVSRQTYYRRMHDAREKFKREWNS